MAQKPDHWSSQAYVSAASFVPKLATKVVALLAPQPGESIIDLGCGDGPLTAELATAVGSNGRVLGLDASQGMISAAGKQHAAANVEFRVRDCARIADDAGVAGRKWDAIFSNAALHWVLRAERAREGLFKDCFAALRSGGRLVFEMGGKHNVDEVHAATLGALVAHGVPMAKAGESMPWFFPSDAWMRKTLEETGFDVKVCELEFRPTKLTPKNDQGTGGLEGWMRLMVADPLTAVEESKREAVLKTACELLDSIVAREEDGSQWLGYVRLRVEAVKP